MIQRKLLGTAQWGWNTSREEAFDLLDAWLQAGEKEIDAATNYPINKNPSDFRAAEQILQEYIRAHGLSGQLAVTIKIGSMDNMRSPEVNLSPSFLRMMTEEYQRLLGPNLYAVMIHWDNRDNLDEIAATLETLSDIAQKGLRIGLSGIRHPDLYALANEKGPRLTFDIQIKHNVLNSDLERYRPLLGGAHQVLAYGLNAGGVKFSGQYLQDSTLAVRGGAAAVSEEKLKKIEGLLPQWNTAFVRPPIITMNHLGLIWANAHPDINGIVVGVRHPGQLAETRSFLENVDVFDYSDVVKSLLR